MLGEPYDGYANTVYDAFSSIDGILALVGTNGFVMNGEQTNAFSGKFVACAGDMNGDEIADLLMNQYVATDEKAKQNRTHEGFDDIEIRQCPLLTRLNHFLVLFFRAN